MYSRSTQNGVKVSEGPDAEKLEFQAMMIPTQPTTPNGYNLSDDYYRKLYDVLLRSIGKVGNESNFWRNHDAVKSICKTHFMTEVYINNLTDEYLREIKGFFLTLYNMIFDTLGVKDILPTA